MDYLLLIPWLMSASLQFTAISGKPEILKIS
jgi:hypothetical protein